MSLPPAKTQAQLDAEYEYDMKSGARREIKMSDCLLATIQFFPKSPIIPQDSVVLSFYGIGDHAGWPGFNVCCPVEDFEKYRALIAQFVPARKH